MRIKLQNINGQFRFSGQGASDYTLFIDNSADHGGSNQGARPMELVLMALASCSAFDIVQILKKQRQKFHSFNISAEGKRRNQVPAVFTSIHMTFEFIGPLEDAKVRRAVELSVEKYCSVYEMLKNSVHITWSYYLKK